MAKTSPLRKVTDAAQWDAEDTFGRLAIVAHAAFLYEGFTPIDVPDATPSCVSRRYSVPQLAHREAADAVVLCLSRRARRRGGCGRGKVVIDAYIDSNGHQRAGRRERLALDTLAVVFSGSIDAVAGALMGTGAWLWKLLADTVCRGLFLFLCRHNGVPLPSFSSLPVDVQLTIVCRLRSAVDVARVECAGKEPRRLVAEHDAMIWKGKYEAIKDVRSVMTEDLVAGANRRGATKPPFVFVSDEDMPPWMIWKEKYVVARWQRFVMVTWLTAGAVPIPSWTPWVPSSGKVSARLETISAIVQEHLQHIPWRYARRVSMDLAVRHETHFPGDVLWI